MNDKLDDLEVRLRQVEDRLDDLETKLTALDVLDDKLDAEREHLGIRPRERRKQFP
jgi:hypothetical protein